MNKIVVGIVGALLLSSVAFAKDNMFISAEIGYSNSSLEDSSYKGDYESLHTWYRLGKYFDEYRLSMIMENSDSIGIYADYLFLQENSSFTPYIGASIGYFYSESTFNAKDSSYHSSSKKNRTSIGGNVGIIYEISNNFEIDSGCGVGIFTANDNLSGNGISCAIGINYLFIN